MPYVEGRVVHDADAHIMETPNWLRDHADPDVRDRIEPLRFPGGNELRQTGDVEDQLRDLDAAFDRLAAKHRSEEYRAAEAEEIMLRKNFAATGSFLPEDRGRALDLIGVVSQLLFNTFHNRRLRNWEHSGDVDLAYGAARAHNRGMVEFCSADPRLLPTCYVPLVDFERAAAMADEALAMGAGWPVPLFPLRDGKMIDRYGFHLENAAGEDAQSILEAFVLEYYGAAPSAPPEVLVSAEIDMTALAEFLSERRGSRVVVRTPLRGEKRRLVELAAENARLALASDSAIREATRSRRIAALEELREVLNLESLPVRIECFDVSNIQGESIVASMTVFVDGRAKNAHYRTFSIRGLDGQDDVGAMREAVSRRFARLSQRRPRRELLPDAEPRRRRRRQGAARRSPRRNGGARPAEGGRHRAREARRGGLRARISRADRPRPLEPGTPAPAADPRRGASCCAPVPPKETWRALDGDDLRRLPGVGPARRRAIIRHFGSVERFLEASQEELEGVAGLPQKTARTVYAQLHKAGPS